METMMDTPSLLTRSMLSKGCEAFWRDVKYAVMARNYQWVKDLSSALKDAQEQPVEALVNWLRLVKYVEAQPISDAALRNTVFHLMGYWKETLLPSERRRLSRETMLSASDGLAFLKERLGGLHNDYLKSSYIWLDEPWEHAIFTSRGASYRLLVHGEPVSIDKPVPAVRVAIEPWSGRSFG